MALKYTLKTATIKDGEQEIATVRGLSLNDIVQLLLINREAAGALFDELNGRDPEELTPSDITAVGSQLIESFPGFVAQIIAIAADAYEEEGSDESPIETILTMPVGVQIAALEKIGELTFVGSSPKKLIALALKMAQQKGQSMSTAQ